jgi:hypothetical protein
LVTDYVLAGFVASAGLFARQFGKYLLRRESLWNILAHCLTLTLTKIRWRHPTVIDGDYLSTGREQPRSRSA